MIDVNSIIMLVNGEELSVQVGRLEQFVMLHL